MEHKGSGEGTGHQKDIGLGGHMAWGSWRGPRTLGGSGHQEDVAYKRRGEAEAQGRRGPWGEEFSPEGEGGGWWGMR